MKEIKMDEKKQNEILINCLLSAVHFDFSKEDKKNESNKHSKQFKGIRISNCYSINHFL